MLQVVNDVPTLRAQLAMHSRAGARVALVPTMGALHAGHGALIAHARTLADIVVLSIFVNPLQFLPGEDLARYPRPVERDRALAETHGVDLVFMPSPDTMYAAGSEIRVVAGATADRWEGATRPGHFTGVLTVVAKLFNIVLPDVAVFGQKDIQQVTLVRRMIADLDFDVELAVVPIVRESDGLALSSRNVYLDGNARSAALALPRALDAVRDRWRAGERDATELRSAAGAVLAGTSGVVADYIAVVDPVDLQPVDVAREGTIVAVAAAVGPTRLIDNLILGEDTN